MGDPNRLKVGEMGRPQSARRSASTAPLLRASSAPKGRSLPQETSFLHSDRTSAINPGNSGGPLFNMRGEVVESIRRSYSRTGGFMGLSFAIPIDVAMEVQSSCACPAASAADESVS